MIYKSSEPSKIPIKRLVVEGSSAHEASRYTLNYRMTYKMHCEKNPSFSGEVFYIILNNDAGLFIVRDTIQRKYNYKACHINGDTLFATGRWISLGNILYDNNISKDLKEDFIWLIGGL